MMDQDLDGLLSREEIIACYRTENHPDVRTRLRASAQVQQDMLCTLDDVLMTTRGTHGEGVVSFPAFLDFYSSLTAFVSDDHFRDTIVAVWAAPMAAESERSFAFQVLGAGGGLVANLRSQILSRGLPGVTAFRRGVRNARSGGGIVGAEELTQEGFHAAVRLVGADLTAQEMAQAFRHLDRRNVQAIRAADALRAVRGEINKHRAEAIKKAFDSLLYDADRNNRDNTEDDETLDPSTVAQLFNAEAHPDVVAGTREAREVLSEFLEAFDGGGEIGGRVTRGDWWEHHADISALIPGDKAFCAYLHAVWKNKSTCDSKRFRTVDTTTAQHKCRAGTYRHSNTTMTNNPADSTPAEDRSRLSMNMADETETDNSSSGSRPRQTIQQHPVEVNEASTIPYQAPAPIEAWGARVPQTVHTKASVSARMGRRPDNTRMCPGVRCLLDRVRDNLATRGVSGAFRLLKGLRQMDESGNGTVALAGFKKAVGDAELGLKEAEMRILFEHLDEREEGQVPYEYFLGTVREPLSQTRLALAHEVFNRIDADGDGFVFVEDVTKAFRAAAHPEVVSGSRSEDGIQREFLESFAVSDGAGRRCSRGDFLAWMEQVSASLPTPAADKQFEDLVRSCWGLSEQPGASKNDHSSIEYRSGLETANAQGKNSATSEGRPIRVIVTSSGGSVSVEDAFLRYERQLDERLDEKHCDGTSISEKQAKDIRRQLAARGIRAVHVRPSPGSPTIEHLETGGDTMANSNAVPRRNHVSEKWRIARLGPAGNCGSTQDYGGGGTCSGLDQGLLSALISARKQLALRGPAGFFSLSRRLRVASSVRPPTTNKLPAAAATVAADIDNSRGSNHGSKHSGGNTSGNGGLFLTLAKFKEALSGVDCGLTGKDATSVFQQLDSAGHGEVPTDTVTDAVRGQLHGKRLLLVRAAFSRLERSGKGNSMGEAVASDVAKAFNSAAHPEVMAGRRDAEDVCKEFLDAMTTTMGVVTRKDFETYYADVSAATPSDDYFSLQLQSCWGLGQAAAAAATAAVPSSQSATAVDPANSHAAGDVSARLGGDFDPTLARRLYTKARTSAPAGVLPGTVAAGLTVANEGGGAVVRRARGRVPAAGVDAILKKLSVEVIGQGATWGLAGLRRALHEADRDEDGLLSLREFKSALESACAGLTPAESRALFTHLETGGMVAERNCAGQGYGIGVAPWRLLLEEIRPALSGKRLGLVRLAFRRMDRRGGGGISARTLKERCAELREGQSTFALCSHQHARAYHVVGILTLLDSVTGFDASRHPHVLKAHATEEEMYKELLDTFFAGAETGDGRITEQEFIEHHANLSFGVPEDEEFRQIVTNCWGLDGSYHSKGDVTHIHGDDNAQQLLKTGGVADLNNAPPPSNRRTAWSWGPMSLSEIHDTKTATAVPNPGHIDTNGEERSDGDSKDENQGSHVRAHGGAGCTPGCDNRVRTQDESNGVLGTEIYSVVDDGVAIDGDVARSDCSERGTDHGGAGGRARRRLRITGREGGRLPGQYGREADLSVRYLMEKVRSELNTRGVAGTATLARRLREISERNVGRDGHACLGVGEVDFRRALKEIHLPLTESDARRLFTHFETSQYLKVACKFPLSDCSRYVSKMGRSGGMDPDAFVGWLSGHMSDRRRAVVDAALRRLGSTSGDGELELDLVMDAFDATRHPEVVRGRLAPDEVFRDFFSGFTACLSEKKRNGGKVDRQDFIRYYDTVSATVPDDGYFERLLRSSWSIPIADEMMDINDRQNWATAQHATSGGQLDPLEDRDRSLDGVGRGSSMGAGYHPSCDEKTTPSDRSYTRNGGYNKKSTPVFHLQPNEDRELSYDSLRKSRPAGTGLNSSQSQTSSGPSEQNRKLRAAHLSRTFDSQISFGREEETGQPRHQAAPGSGGGVELLPPAGGGKAGRLAEGAAWTPGGRRHVPGSKIFMSNLGSGLKVAKDETGALIEHKDNRDSNDFEPPPVVRRPRAVLAPRKGPVWLPEGTFKVDQNVIPRGTTVGADEGLHGRSPFDSVSLAQLASSTFEGLHGDCGYSNERHGGPPPVDAEASGSTGGELAAPGKRGGGSDNEKNILQSSEGGSEYDGQASSLCSSFLPRAGQDERNGFDWWGGASTLRPENIDGRGGQSKHVSDTFKSSLVFG